MTFATSSSLRCSAHRTSFRLTQQQENELLSSSDTVVVDDDRGTEEKWCLIFLRILDSTGLNPAAKHEGRKVGSSMMYAITSMT